MQNTSNREKAFLNYKWHMICFSCAFASWALAFRMFSLLISGEFKGRSISSSGTGPDNSPG